MLNSNQLFLHTLKDLEDRSKSSDPYTILGISGLLRKLLLDDHPLLDQVNREFGHRLTFRVLESESVDQLKANGVIYYDVVDGLDPDAPTSNKDIFLDLKRDAFLKKLVAFSNGTPITIQDIIKYEANIGGGGVHAPSEPREYTHATLKAVNQTISLKGYSVSVYHLRSIAKLVLRAIEPLRASVENTITDKS